MNPKTGNDALRMLREGSTPAQIYDRLGVTREQLEQLVTALPGKRPTWAPTSGATCEHVTRLPVASLHGHLANVRSTLGPPGDFDDLVQSIRHQGVLQPITVMQQRGRWLVLAGHRRLAAAKAAGLTHVPVAVAANRDDPDAIEAMLVENLQRAGLDPLDEAHAYGELLAAGRTQADIAAAVGKNQGHISQRLALLNLTPAEQNAVRQKEITVDAAYKAGRDRSPRRRPHDVHRPKPRRVPHFTKAHPLAAAVAVRCGHEVTLKLGPGCGPCWEAVIRDDALDRAPADPREAPPCRRARRPAAPAGRRPRRRRTTARRGPQREAQRG